MPKKDIDLSVMHNGRKITVKIDSILESQLIKIIKKEFGKIDLRGKGRTEMSIISGPLGISIKKISEA